MSRSSAVVRRASASQQGRILHRIMSRFSSSTAAASTLSNVEHLHRFNPQLWNLSSERLEMEKEFHPNNSDGEDDKAESSRMGDVIYSLSFVKDATSTEHDYYTTAADFFLPCTPLMRRQLNNVVPDSMRALPSMQEEEDRLLQQQEAGRTAPTPSADVSDLLHLPRTVGEVLENDLDPRAIVVTEAITPFRITHVNDAWVELCGYCPEEAIGEPIGALLRQNAPTEEKEGPEETLTAALVHVVLRGEAEAGAVVTNFTAEGRPFRNRLRIGPLTDDGSRRGRVTHFVGVLKEVEA